MVNANSFCGCSDSEILEKAIQNRQEDGIVLIPPREASLDPQRKYWLLDRAILLPENTTVILQNCKLKLSDRCRDNFFRSANCGFGFPDPAPIQNIHIHGEGLCTLEGADRPRATGDGSKRIHNPCPHLAQDICRIKADWVPAECSASGNLNFWDIHAHSYGTDAGTEGESQYGDWRGIGILFANVENFSIQNIRIVNSHGWGISLEACSFGTLRDISFDAHQFFYGRSLWNCLSQPIYLLHIHFHIFATPVIVTQISIDIIGRRFYKFLCQYYPLFIIGIM